MIAPSFVLGRPVLAFAEIGVHEAYADLFDSEPVDLTRITLSHGYIPATESASGLAVLEGDEDPIWLVYCNSEWSCIFLTWHESMEEAMRQGELDRPEAARCWIVTNRGGHVKYRSA